MANWTVVRGFFVGGVVVIVIDLRGPGEGWVARS